MRKHFLITTLCGLSLLSVIAASAILVRRSGLYERWRELRSGRVFYAARTEQPVLALTFDDGPDPRYTARILDVLKAQHVRGTFFVCGRMLAAHPELARRIVAEGHVLGNHTETHPHLEREANPDVRRELDLCEQKIERITGERTHLFRPPRGLWNAAAFRDARQEGYRIILWSLAFDRSAVKDSSVLRRRIVRLARPGDIILMHDGSAGLRIGRDNTVRELNNVIVGLRNRGFRFTTVPELLHIAGDEPVARVPSTLAQTALRLHP